jgi:hypothetical protein
MANKVVSLTPSILCRWLLVHLSRSLNAEYRPGPEAIIGQALSQTWVETRVDCHALKLDIDDFADRHLIQLIAPFLSKIIQQNAGYFYDLPLWNDRPNARGSFDGLLMRCTFTPLFSDPMLGDVYVPQADWEKYVPCGYEIRFDVLHSRRLGIESRAAA